MRFEGSFSKSRKGARIVLTSPSNKNFNFAYRLEFDASNNVPQYEALLLGLEIAKDMGIRVLIIKGVSDLIFSHVKNQFACKFERQRKYRNDVRDTMEYLNALDLMAVPWLKNSEVDKLAIVPSTLEFNEEMIKGNGKFEINFRPSIPDNLNHWQVFKDD